jgi:hypothetical protein
MTNVERQIQTHRQILVAAGVTGALVDSVPFISRYTASFSDKYRGRAAVALAHIGGTQAITALDAAKDSVASVASFKGVAHAVLFARDSVLSASATSFKATLTGAAAVPPVVTGATGTATLVVIGSHSINYSVSVAGASNVVNVGIYLGAPAAIGPVAMDLCGQGAAAPCASGPGLIIAGTSSTTVGISFAGLLENMRTNGAYIRVVTTTNPTGLVRGQVLPVP